MKGFNPRTYIAFGLAFLVMSLLLAAAAFGLIPDRVGAVRDGRTVLSESVAAAGTALATRGDPALLESTLRLIVQRNPDVLSMAMRRADGRLLVAVGDHQALWIADTENLSTDTQMQVPIMAGDTRWGQLEIRYHPLVGSGVFAILNHPLFKLIAFVFLICAISFYFYLGKVLRQLDPSQAVPGRVRAALDTLAEGLLIVDRKQNIVLANHSFAAFLGKVPEELTGQSAARLDWRDVDNLPVSKDQLPWLATLRDASVQQDTLLNLPNVQGKMRNFVVSCSPVLASGGKANGVFISLNDVTQIEHGKVELRKAMNEAEAANKAKSEFLANMSHEIRTPMNAILGFTELLRRGYGKNEKESGKFLDTIHSSGKHLLELINDLLDMSKIEAGQFELLDETIEMDPLIRSCMKMVEPRAAVGQVILDAADPLQPFVLRADRRAVRQIMLNLIANAVKFTPAGGSVTVGLETDCGGMAFVVRDTGIGIAKDALAHLGEPFSQADASIGRRFGGTGLGLAITQKLLALHGGALRFDSELGRGTTVWAVFPPERVVSA